jgi:hypothetical protein
LLFETDVPLLNFSWQRSILKLCIKSFSWFLLFPTISVRSSNQQFFNEISCNDVQNPEARSCRSDVATYVTTAVGCLILTGLLMGTMVSNHIYLVKDWINKYDHLAFNRPQFMLLLDCYIVVRAITDSLPFDQMSIYVYYSKCLIMTIYTIYMLAFALFKVVFQSLHVQQ